MKNLLKVLSAALIITFLMIPFSNSNVYAVDDNNDQTTEGTQNTEDEIDETTSASVEEESGSEDTTESDYRGIVAHWKFDGDLNDSSQFANNGVAVGKIEYADAIHGKGAKFSGKNYIEVANSDSLNLKDAFTFSMWIFKEDMRGSDGMDGGVPYFEKMNDEYGYWPYGMYEWWEFKPGISYGYDESSGDIHSDKLMDIQKWTLLTATYDGKTMKIFLNDELVKSELVSVTLDSSSAPLYIGFGNFMNRDNFFKGIMDDLRIYNTALTYEEVEELYQEGLEGTGKDLLKKPNRLVAFYNFEGNGNDSSIMKNNAKAVNAKGGISYVTGIVGKAAKFNGASYFEIPDSNSLDLDNFTVSLWLYEEKVTGRNPVLTKYGAGAGKKEPAYSLYDSYGLSGINMETGLFDDDDSYAEFSTNTAVAAERWYYRTFSYDGKNVKIYTNGTLVKTIQCDSAVSYSSGPMWLGALMDGSFFKGMMDELRIYNYALTPAEVKKLYSYVDKVDSVQTDTKINLSTLSVNKTVQLKTTYTAYTFTAPTNPVPNGVDVYKGTDVTTKAIYKSSNTKVATVTTGGKITTVGKGTATITITYNGRSKVLTLTVK